MNERITIGSPETLEDVWAATHFMWEAYEFQKTGKPEDFFIPYQLNDPTFRYDNLRVLWIGERIAATVRVFFRRVFVNGDYAIAGGIGNVATSLDYRGRGFAKTLMEDAIEYMSDCGAAFSTLYTGKPDFYRRFGYDVVERKSLSCMIAGSMAEIHGVGDITKAMSIYRSDRPGAFLRSAPYWRHWVKGFRMSKASVLCGENAYAIYHEEENGEVLLLDGAGDMLSELISVGFPGRRVKVYDVDPSHPLYRAIALAGGDLRESPCLGLMSIDLNGRAPSSFGESSVDHF